MYPLRMEEIAPGISFNTIIDKRFKTNRISVNMFLNLAEDTAAEYAILPFLLRNGYSDCPDLTQLNRKLMGLYGASLDGDVSKIGDNQILHLSIGYIDDAYALDGECLSVEATEILSSVLLRPVLENGIFRLRDIEIEKSNLVDIIESEINEKRAYAINRITSLMFSDEPYGINKYGTAPRVKELTAEGVTRAYYQALATANIQIMFVGAGDGEPVRDAFAKAFEGVKRAAHHEIKTQPAEPVVSQQETTEYFKVAQSKMVLGFRMAGSAGNNMHAMRLMSAVYGGTAFSKLFLNVREKLSLCYYCQAQFDQIKGVMLVDCGVENQNIEKARVEILHQLEEIRRGNLTEEELDKTKRSVVNMLQTVGDSPGAVEGWYISQICGNTHYSPQDEIEIFNGLSIEDIIQAAKNVKLDTVYILTAKEGD